MRYNFVRNFLCTLSLIVAATTCAFADNTAAMSAAAAHAAAGVAPNSAAHNFIVLSNAFPNGGNIPAQYTCDGDNLSPMLSWLNAPQETKSFAIMVIDPDAKKTAGHEWIHWLVYNIPASVTTIPVNEGLYPQGINSFGKIGYGGPCPPRGMHHYYFVLYALDIEGIDLPRGITMKEFMNAIQKHILQQTVLMGTYTRQKTV